MAVVNGTPLLLAAGGGGYEIQRSVRLRGSASGYLARTFASTGNRQKWTWAAWVKRGQLSAFQSLFSQYVDANNRTYIFFNSTNQLSIFGNIGGTLGLDLTTVAVQRDCSAWYHVVVAVDTTLATAADRVKMYINGVQMADDGVVRPAQNYQSYINTAAVHEIGRRNNSLSYYHYDGYITDVHFINDAQLAAPSFGEFDAITGVWKPKQFSGTYGTNGFKLDFADNSAATAAAIGKDSSGNGNNWTPNNISVTAGVTYDSMLDVPTLWADGGNGRGNYCTLNPLDVSGTMLTLSNGNLTATQPSTGTSRVAFGSMLVTTGKWYFEGSVSTTSNVGTSIAIGDTANTSVTFAGYRKTGGTFGLTGSPTFNTYASGDVIGVAFDMDASTITFYKNGVAQGTGAYSFTNGGVPASARLAIDSLDTTGAWSLNFGQRPFAFSPPTGFKALQTGNLPEPTIPNGRKFFDARLWTGTGAAVTLTGVGFAPDLAWNKDRTAANSNTVYDIVRGVQKEIVTNSTGAESTEANGLQAFTSDGVTFGTRQSQSGNSQVTWLWKEGATQGFDIVTYTGTGVARTVAHNLGVAPAMMIVKNRSQVSSWRVYHQNANASPASGNLFLQATNAFFTDATCWNNTAPTSSVFSVGTSGDTNASGIPLVAYLFAEVAGFSKFGSYTGNGSADGPFVFTGFLPRWVMIKPTVGTGSWQIIDTARDAYNVAGNLLWANESTAETSSPPRIDVLSNGFKARAGAGSAPNVSGEVYVYAAFASNPFRYSLAR